MAKANLRLRVRRGYSYSDSPFSANTIEFFRRVGELKYMARTGWIQRSVKNSESVADHSFRLACMAMVTGDQMGIDAAKMIRMSLLHDLPEIITGDIATTKKMGTSEAKLYNSERRALGRVLSHLPDAISRKYMKLWAELGKGRSREAIMVKDLDKFEMVLQATDYSRRSLLRRRALLEFLETAESQIRHKELRKLARRMVEAETR